MGRHKRSISLPPDLDADIEEAAAEAGLSVSAWIAELARHRLRLDAGRKGIEEWEAENGPLTPEERAEGRARLYEALDRAEAHARQREAAEDQAASTHEDRRTA